jgi:hypothetical protein
MVDKKPRLELHRETLRELTRKDMELAVGGSPKQSETCPPLTITLLCTVTRA